VGVVDRQLRLQLHRRRVSTPTDFTAADDGPIFVEVLVHMYEPNEQGRESSGCGFPGAGVGSFLTCALVPRMRAAGKKLGIILSSSSRCAHDCAQQLPPTPELKTSLVSRVPVVPGRCVVPLVPAVIARGWPQIGENHSVPPPCCCSHAPAAHVLRTTSAASLSFSYQLSFRRAFPSCG
jgi:hypothetical protein